LLAALDCFAEPVIGPAKPDPLARNDGWTCIELTLPKPSSRKRADLLLVERGLFETRARAQAAIEAGLVTANDKQVTKPSEGVPVDAALQAQPAHPFVSRGGVKLSGALEQYPIEIENRVCLDVGASTGGFTEVLLANGASLVFAIDVGHGQLHPSLHGHPNIVSMEKTDIRKYENKRLPMRPDVVVIDVSFISLKAVLPVALALAAAPMHLLALIKPQFEAPRKHAKGGIIRNAMVHQQVCDEISAFAASLGCTDIQLFPSAIKGGDGNIEFFLGARRG
jgi:23S rRNA (cytidine1920-2'-O)/16S rRNA (cytidine1409-2'-O)-methyltransferase